MNRHWALKWAWMCVVERDSAPQQHRYRLVGNCSGRLLDLYLRVSQSRKKIWTPHIRTTTPRVSRSIVGCLVPWEVSRHTAHLALSRESRVSGGQYVERPLTGRDILRSSARRAAWSGYAASRFFCEIGLLEDINLKVYPLFPLSVSYVLR
jgi:hypothetical protein